MVCYGRKSACKREKPKGDFMSENEKNFPENMGEIDTVSGDMNNNEVSAGAPTPKKTRAPLSKRTKKRLVAVAIATGAVLLALAIVLITVSILNNRPPKFEDVRGRFEELLVKSQEINEIIWGAGLPVYSRVDAETQVFEVGVKKANGDAVIDAKTGKPVTAKLRYYLYDDATYGKIVSYEYQWRVAEGKKNEDDIPVYTVYDVENGGELTAYKNGAARFAQKSVQVIAGQTPIFEKNGYYYYALPNYENADLAASSILYSGKEDSHYDYVRPNATYRNTDDVKAAIGAVYAGSFVAPLYENLFTGMVGATNDVYQAAYTDYIEEGTDREWLMKSNESGAWKWRAPLPTVTFDFSTMQMTEGNASKVSVKVSYRLAGEDVAKEMEVDFVLEGGVWLLNTPTFG